LWVACHDIAGTIAAALPRFLALRSSKMRRIGSRSPLPPSPARRAPLELNDQAPVFSIRLKTARWRSPISTPGDSDHPIVVEKVQARDGVTGHGVRYVLGFSLVAIVVVFGAIYFAYFG
jgi:hypothetical protein